MQTLKKGKREEFSTKRYFGGTIVQTLTSRNSNENVLKFNSGSLRFLKYVWNVKLYCSNIQMFLEYLCKYVLKFRLTKVKKIWDWSFGCKKALALYTLPTFCHGPIFVHYFRNSKRGFGQFCACTRWQKQWHVCQTHCMEFSNWKSATPLFKNTLL